METFGFFFQKYLYARFSEGSSDIWFQHLEWTYALISSTLSYKYKGHPLDLWNAILFNLRDTQLNTSALHVQEVPRILSNLIGDKRGLH